MSKNKKWLVGDTRWNSRLKQRVEEAFRRHVRRPKNPQGRIERQPCGFCIRLQVEIYKTSLQEAIRIANNYRSQSEFHHIDYTNSFLGVWCCKSHHRMIEHGTVRIWKRDIWDYTSMVAPLLRPR